MTPCDQGQSAAPPRWLSIVAAALAACLATTIPGLAWTLHASGRTSPDLTALVPELVVAAILGAFGARRMRQELLGAGRRAGAWLVAADIVLVGVMGLVVDLDLSSGSVDTGPIFVLGLLVVLAAMTVHAALAFAIVRLIAALRAGLPGPDARARLRCAAWLVAAGVVHLIVKGVAGGPVVFGVAAFGIGAVLAARAWRAERSTVALRLVAFGALGAIAGTVTQVSFRARAQHEEALALVPVCSDSDALVYGHLPESDMLARRVRQIAGVADAETDFTFPNSTTTDLTVVVLPSGGGPLDAPLKDTVEQALRTVVCAEDGKGTRPPIAVAAPAYVPITITARARIAPDADVNAVRHAVTDAVRDAFDPNIGGRELIVRRSHSLGIDPRAPAVAGLRGVDYRGDGEYLSNRLAQLAPNSVPVVRRVDVETAVAPAGAQ